MQINKACTTRGTRKRILVKVSWSWKRQGGLQAHLGLQSTSQLCGKRNILNRAFGRTFFFSFLNSCLESSFIQFYFIFEARKLYAELGYVSKKDILGFWICCRYLIYTQSNVGSCLVCVFFCIPCDIVFVFTVSDVFSSVLLVHWIV